MNGRLQGVSAANYVAAADRETLVDPGHHVLQSHRGTLCCRLMFSDSSALTALEDGEVPVLSLDPGETRRKLSPKPRGGVGAGRAGGGGGMIVLLGLAVLGYGAAAALASVEAVSTTLRKARFIDNHAEGEDSPPREAMVAADVGNAANGLNQDGLRVLDAMADLFVPSFRPRGYGGSDHRLPLGWLGQQKLQK